MLLLIISSVSVFVAALYLSSLFDIRRISLKLMMLIFFWVWLVTLISLVAGAIGILDPPGLTLLSLLPAIFIVLFKRREMILALHRILNIRKLFFSTLKNHPAHSILIIVVFLFILIRQAIHVVYLAPFVYDVLVYHLPRVAEWIQNSQFVYIDTPITRVNWPANFELLQAWMVVFIRHDCVIEVAGLIYYAILSLGAYSISRYVGLRRLASVYSVLVFILTPAIFLNAVSCKNDIAVSALFIALIAVILWGRKAKIPLSNPVLLLFMIFMLCVGVKPYCIFMLPGILILAGYALFSRRSVCLNVDRAWAGKSCLSTLFLLSLFVGSYWYLRNCFIFQNPFYPVETRIMGMTFHGDQFCPGQQGHFNLHNLFSNMSDLFTIKIFDLKQVYEPDMSNKACWGWFVFACGIPASITALFLSKKMVVLEISFLLSFCGLMGAVENDPWNMRFAAWAVLPLVIAFFVVLSKMSRSSIRNALIILAIICCALNVVAVVNNGFTQRWQWKDLIRMPLKERCADYCFNSFVKGNMPVSEVIGFSISPNDNTYHLYGPDYSRHIKRIVISMGKGIDGSMRLNGVRYLYCPTSPGGELNSEIENEIRSGRIEKMTEGLYIRK